MGWGGLRDADVLEYSFEAGSTDALWLTRVLVEQWLRDRRVRDSAVDDLLLLAHELCTRAVRHHGAAPAPVTLRLRIAASDVEIEVEDGCGSDAPLAGPGDDEVSDLRLAATLSDELVLRVERDRTVARCRKHDAILPV